MPYSTNNHICGFRDFWGPSNEESCLIKDDPKRFRSRFSISSAFQVKVQVRDGRVTNALEGQVALYEESLEVGL